MISLKIENLMSERQKLKNITLISITSIDIESAANALLISSEHCDFGAIKLLSPSKPKNLHSSIEHIVIPPIVFFGYSKIMIEELHKFVDTEFCLIVQADGFVINPGIWSNQFLEYDYIGAPWPDVVGVYNSSFNRMELGKNRVGNGGFSLRSKKLLDICSRINFDQLDFPIKSEDLIICHYLYGDMLKAGIKFAPFDIAKKFSIESLIESQYDNLGSSFGFHGKNWLASDYLDGLATASIYRTEFTSLLQKKYVAILPGKQTRIGRLEPCPCGSKKRFKDCHGKIS